MKQYKEISFGGGTTLDDAISTLLQYNKEGRLVCGNFNETMLYSDTINIDSAYNAVFGRTKVEYEKWYQSIFCKTEEEKNEFRKTIPILAKELIKKGKEILTKEDWVYWEYMVFKRLNGRLQGKELNYCLEIVQILNKGITLKDARDKLYSQNHFDFGTFVPTIYLIEKFCKRGKDFSRYINENL